MVTTVGSLSIAKKSPQESQVEKCEKEEVAGDFD